MSEVIHGNCPHCEKALQIPADLTEFSCLYCGKRCRTEFLINEKTTIDINKCSQELEEIRQPLLQAVVSDPNAYKKITKKDFFRTFDAFESNYGKLVDQLDALARTAPDGKLSCIRTVCTALVDDLQAYFESDPKWAKKSRQEDLLFNTRIVLAIFLTPLVRKRKLVSAELFCQELQQIWLKRFPTQMWTPGDYEVLAGGFNKRKLCFITTATYLHEGKSDTCAELQAFRAFRDGYLTENGGETDIAQYYDLAPTIVTCIEHLGDSERVYAEIREKWLTPCYRALQENRNADCRRIYTDMVKTLQEKYLQ